MKIEPTMFEHIFNEDIFIIESKPLAQAIIETETIKPNWIKNGSSKEVIVMVKKSEIPDSTLMAFLEKIISAVKFPFEELTICTEYDLPNLIEEYNPKKIILFNINPFEQNLKGKTIQLYEATNHNNIQLLRVDSLSVISQNTDKKKSLWICLQRVFF